MNTKNIIAIMLASTLCATVIATVATALIYPPGTVTETFRQKIFEILNIILGAVIMYLGLPKDDKKGTEAQGDKGKDSESSAKLPDK